jgi:hypothetical protein
LFGALDNDPLNEYGKPLVVGSNLAISYGRVREHRKGSEFGRPN